MNEEWKPIGYESRDWVVHYNSSYISNRQRSKIKPTYSCALPLKISGLNVDTDRELSLMIDDALVLMARFDANAFKSGQNFPAMLLRSESAASSQIENLTSSIRNIAWAELSNKAPYNAKLIAGNVAAMRKALELSDEISVPNILEIHNALISPTGESFAGKIRTEQVWIGGSSYSPHGAIFVPPHQSRIAEYLEDLVAYSERSDLNPIVKAAVLHAQFETIHPFIDGNGRTGRTLLHKILRRERVLLTATLPISAGLLHNIDGYMTALREYQQGNPLQVIYQVTKAIELAVNIGAAVTESVSEIFDLWRAKISEKQTASIWKLLPLLAEQPVVDAKYVSAKLGITERAARDMFIKAQEYGILRKLGDEVRGRFYQADDIILLLNDVSDTKNIRRLFTRT